MIIEFQKKHTIILSIIVALLVSAIVLFYYVSYTPKQMLLDQKNQEIQIEEQLIQVLQQQGTTDTSVTNTIELQRKIPVAPYVEQLMLELEKAEVVSNSRISNMTFGDAPFAATTTLDEYVNSTTNQSTEEEQSEQEAAYLPEGLKKVTVTLSVQSDDYEDLTLFLKELESLTRVTQIESVSFTGRPEITSITQEITPISYSVQLSAFYHPELVDLLNDLPPIHVPEPSNKTNPFIDNE